MNAKHLLMLFGGAWLLGQRGNASPILTDSVNSNNDLFTHYPPSRAVTEFVGRNASYMLDQALGNAGSENVDSEELRAQLFNDDGNLDSARLWNAWTTYNSSIVYEALKRSTNGGANDTSVPPEEFRAAVVMSLIALMDISGPLQLPNGELPDFTFKFGVPLNGHAWKLPGHLHGYMQVEVPDSYDPNQPHHIRRVMATTKHEFDHTVNCDEAWRLFWPIKARDGQPVSEPYTEFLATLWTRNTTDNPEREMQMMYVDWDVPNSNLTNQWIETEQGQYKFTAIASALSDARRNAGNLADLQLQPSDYPPVYPDTSSPPILPGQYEVGIRTLCDAYYRCDKDAIKKVEHLIRQAYPQPAQTPTQNPPQTQQPNGWAILGAVLAATTAAVAIAYTIYRNREYILSRAQGSEYINLETRTGRSNTQSQGQIGVAIGSESEREAFQRDENVVHESRNHRMDSEAALSRSRMGEPKFVITNGSDSDSEGGPRLTPRSPIAEERDADTERLLPSPQISESAYSMVDAEEFIAQFSGLQQKLENFIQGKLGDQAIASFNYVKPGDDFVGSPYHEINQSSGKELKDANGVFVYLSRQSGDTSDTSYTVNVMTLKCLAELAGQNLDTVRAAIKSRRSLGANEPSEQRITVAAESSQQNRGNTKTKLR